MYWNSYFEGSSRFVLFLFLTSAERVDAIELRMSFTPAGLGTRRCRGKATNGSFPSWRHQAANQTSALSPSQSRILIKRKAGLISQINAECLFCCEFICNFCWFRFCVMDLSLSLSLPPSTPPALVRAVLRSAVLVLGSRKAPGCFTQASPACCPPTCCPTLVTSFFFHFLFLLLSPFSSSQFFLLNQDRKAWCHFAQAGYPVRKQISRKLDLLFWIKSEDMKSPLYPGEVIIVCSGGGDIISHMTHTPMAMISPTLETNKKNVQRC